MFDHNRLSIEEAKERMHRFIQEEEDDRLYRQLRQSNGTFTWFTIVVILIMVIVMIW
jgi:CHASE3 domain sensor protein